MGSGSSMKRKRKILVINPVGTSKWNKPDKQHTSNFKSTNTTITVENIEYGSHSLESEFDVTLNSPYVLKLAKAERKNYDGMIINCFLNPGLDAVREIVDIPVVGPGYASIYIACDLGDQFSILGLSQKRKSHPYGYRKLARSAGVESRLSSVQLLPIPVLELKEDKKRTMNALINAGEKAKNKGADVLILGCTGLTGFSKQLNEKLNLPVVDPLVAALKFTEILIDMDLSYSRLSYSLPERKPRKLPEELKSLGEEE